MSCHTAGGAGFFTGCSQAVRGAHGTWGTGGADPSSRHLGHQPSGQSPRTQKHRRCEGRCCSETVVHSFPPDFDHLERKNLRALKFEEGLFELDFEKEGSPAKPGKRFPSGEILSSPISPAHPFTEAIVSWNIEIQTATFASFELQVFANGEWSRWYQMGTWRLGKARSGARRGAMADDIGTVDVDTLKLNRKATKFRYRVRFGSLDGIHTPRLELIAVNTADTDLPPALTAAPPFSTGPWVGELAVPERSQFEERTEISRRICSPTSLGMVMDFWGIPVPTAKLAGEVFDHEADIYGNWPFNVAAASAHGLEGYVTRFNSLKEIEHEIGMGRPVIASIRFSKGELTKAPLPKSRGHIVVVRGFTGQGDVIVNDPAARAGSVRRIYKRDEFDKVWRINAGGVVYRIYPRWPKILVCAASSAEVWPAPPTTPTGTGQGKPSARLQRGNEVVGLEAAGDWIRISGISVLRRRSSRYTPENLEAGWMKARSLSGSRKIPRIKR